MKQTLLPLHLQFFASEPQPEGDTGADSDNTAQDQNTAQVGQQSQADFDYDKLASIISGKQSVAEDTVLKNFFKNQGLSKEEMDQAISRFKEEKAKNQPDVKAIQTQLTQAQQMMQKANVEKEATLEAMVLGVDPKTIPYLIKMADLSSVTEMDGKVNKELLKKALNQVLEDVPQLKPAKEEHRGFQIGGGQSRGTDTNDQLASIFGNKK